MKQLFFIGLLLFAFKVYPNTITVCKSCNTTTVKEAIAKAKNGDTILIKQGIYRENNLQIIDKSVTIIGEKNAVIDGGNVGSVFKIRAENFSVEGLTIINVGTSYTEDHAAILISKSNNFTIKNNRLEDVFFGILIEKSKNGKVSGNKMKSDAKEQANSGNGVHIWHSDNISVSKNEVEGMRDGIYLEFANFAVIKDNSCKNNLRYGLHFMFSNNNEYLDNTFSNNGAGVAVMFSKNIKMTRNVFRDNWGPASYGLLLKDITDAELKHNTFENNTIAINADGTSRIDYTENNFIGNGYAVKIFGACYNNVFYKNNFLQNSFDLTYHGNINDNAFNHNYWSGYSGYDLDKDGVGDIPYRPVKLFSYLVNKTPEAIVLLRSLFIDIIDFSEKVSPIFTPAELIDTHPQMKKITW